MGGADRPRRAARRRERRSSDVADSRADGNLLVKADALRTHGAEWLLEQLPPGARFFVTIDVDGLDPSIAPGTRATIPGGLLFHEVAPLMRGLSSRGRLSAWTSSSIARPGRELDHR